MNTPNHAEAAAILGLSPDSPATISVPHAGRTAYGLSRNGSYEAAGRGDIEFIQMGRLKRVPIIALAMKVLATDTPTDA